MVEISFIMPSKDREEILRQSLHHLIDSVAGASCEILVINDSKTSVPVIQHPLVRVINNPGAGVASARNTGAAEAKGELLWFLDDDIWLTPETFQRARYLVKKYPGAVFNFNWVYPDDLNKDVETKAFGRYLKGIGFTTMKGWCRGMEWTDNALFETKWLAGATLLIPASAYKKVNGYDASFPLAGFEDYDFSNRVQKAGIKCYIDTTVLVYHNERGKTNLKGFLQRTYNNAITRKHGVSIGYKDQELKFSFIKRALYSIIRPFENLLIKLSDRENTNTWLDPFFAVVYRLLIGSAIYRGYSKSAEKG